jgi:hypothetical protein
VNPAEPNPTDVLAHKRAQSDAPSSLRRPPDAYHVDMLRSESGRADLFRMLRDAGVWAPTPEREGDRPQWAADRKAAADLFGRLAEAHPLAIASMWGEWAARWHEEKSAK